MFVHIWHAGVPSRQQAAVAAGPDPQPLEDQAGCNPPGGIIAFCSGTLGVCSFPAAASAASNSNSAVPTDIPSPPNAAQRTLFVANNGTIGAVCMLAQHERDALRGLDCAALQLQQLPGQCADFAGHESWGMECCREWGRMSASGDGVNGAARHLSEIGRCCDLGLLHAISRQGVVEASSNADGQELSTAIKLLDCLMQGL